MDPSCECLCDCEAWATRMRYEWVPESDGHQGYGIDKLLCSRCFDEACSYFWPVTFPNPWKNT